jgi:hypothetical protein
MAASGEKRPRMIHQKIGRRRILGGIGASGLAAAVATFAQSTPAFAAYQGCCGLAHPPGTPGYVSYSTCRAHAAYIWNCASGTLGCACCEEAGDSHSGFVCSRAG